jgi:PAS domain S-box-containing protein
MISDSFRDPASLPPHLRFLAGGGEATRLILARDWSTHPLGPPEHWPDSLKATLSTVLNSPESMILAWGRDELTFFFNETYFPLLGPRLSWAMGAPFHEVWADAWAQARPIIDDAFAGQSQRFTDLPWKLGTDRGRADTWFTFSYSRILDTNGDVAGLFIFTNETTDRVLADAALRESEERLRLVIEGAKDHVILTMDVGGTITTWSSGAEAILGWSAGEVIGQPFSLLSTSEDRAAGVDVRELTTAARAGSAKDERWHLTRSGGRVFLNGSTHSLPPDAQGQERGFLKIARDETARRHAEQRLARETERQRMSLQQMPGFVGVLAGPTHLYEYVNDAYVAISGQREFIGRTVRDVFPELAGQGFYELLDGVYASGNPFSGRAVPILLAGENGPRSRFIDLLYQPIRSDTGDIVGIFVGGYDVTERVLAEKALEQANSTLEQRVAQALREREKAEEALRQAQKMEAVGQLTGGIAHDFNNMLTGVIGPLDLLQHHLAKGNMDRVQRYIDAAKTSAQRAAGLTQRLLAFSRRQSLDVKPVDVNALVAGMEDLLRRTLGESIGLEVVLHAEAWPVTTDQNQLESALLNLAINSRDAMPEGGRLTIETANTHLDEAYVTRVDDLQAGDFVVICVSDTGTGMSEAVMAKAFDPFFTTKPIGAGTGLGLSMIYGFAKQSGGHVRIYSEVGRGTTVKLYLPRHWGEVVEARKQAIKIQRARQGERVLLVEDDPAVRMLVHDVLTDLGYGVRQAVDGRAALPMLQEMERIDLLITDVGLPGLNGRQLAEIAREKVPGLKVLFITGYAERAAVRGKFLDAGMEMLTKPFAIDVLSAKIREMLE